ncbi:hypothetical protein GH714_006077 [Hevea brasiliensis]|uniref:ZF-HD dimerization-type domain-containing protein n=1 Tax=Hevea brasiliensis TaxID=3981 RepID=A0A6A6MCP3_HEVBR|nr:hypothetical protein GH714_006077 [Hevea brasiliensis]
MPGGEEGTLEALKCAACECHRNFHRKEVDGETQFSPSSRRSPLVLQLPPPLPSPTVLHHQIYSLGLHTSPTTANVVQPMSVAFGGGGGGGGGTESSSEDLNNAFQSKAEGVPPPPPYVLSKKRFRTKFTQDQKVKMMEFAERIGWRINKQEEEEVQKFCAEVGVKRRVFKVWMHNNKNMKKQQQQQQEEEPLSLYKSYDTMEEALHAFNHANNLPMNSYRGGDGMSLVASSGISTTLGNEEPCQQYLSTINMESKKSLMFGKEDPREESPSIIPGVRKQFQVQYVTRFSQEGVFKKARFEKGWRAFVQENQLGEDDEVEFTLTVADDYRIEFQTEITRAGQ